MERDVAPPSAGPERVAVGRGLNTILTLPQDAAAIRQFLALVIDRLEETAEPSVQALVLAADVDTVMAIGRVASALDRPAHATMLAMTSPKRGARALRAGAPALVIATAADVLALVRESAIKLNTVRVAVFAWAEDLLATDESALATVIAEVPRDAARVLVAARLTPDVEAFAERYVRRIARAAPAAVEPLGTSVSFLAVGSAAKPSALRRVLDALDPESAAVYVRTAEGARDVRAELAGMGAGAAGITVVSESTPIDAELLVLYELPASVTDLRALAGSGSVRRVIALVRGREMALLRALTGANVKPIQLPEPAEQAHAREAAVRDELRAALSEGVPSRELLALEPLLDEFDGIEIAAAALKLLERAREGRVRPPIVAHAATAPAAAEQPAVPSGRSVRLFFNVGSRDGASPRDFVGAIANVGGIPADRIGKVEVRENHTLVELTGADAGSVVEKLAGATIRGRRVAPRLDRERPSSDRGGNAERGAGERRRPASSRDRAPSRERGDRRPPARGRGEGRPADRSGAGRRDRPAPRGRRPN